MKMPYMPATRALAQKLGISQVTRFLVDDVKRSPTRQYKGKKRPSKTGRRAAFGLVKDGALVTKAFWSQANLERHCAKRWHKYTSAKPV